jgi:uncharacterized SAM-binding protein YcdF (DUF218 family)
VIFGPFKLVLKIISGFLTLVVLYLAVTFVQIWMTSGQHPTSNAQAIVVFGTTEDNGRPSAVLAARLDEALALYRAKRAPWIAVTGGKQPGDVYTEAGVSATYLESHGVPASRILRGGGHDTWQNVATIVGALRARHLTTVLTVTDPFHEYRAKAIASAQGLSPQAAPVASSPTIKSSLWYYYARETLDVAVGRIVGYSTLSSWTTTATDLRNLKVPSGG